MNEVREYPKWLHHPSERAAVISDDSKMGRFADAPIGEPIRFPPVMVHNADDEEFHVSRGYTPGTWNRAAVERQQYAPPPGLQQRDYPMYAADGKTILADPSAPPADAGEFPKWVGGEIARNRAEEDEILARRPELAIEARGSSKNEPVEKGPQIAADELAEFRAWKAGQKKPANRRAAPLAKAAIKPARKRRVVSPENLAKLQAGAEKARERRRQKRALATETITQPDIDIAIAFE